MSFEVGDNVISLQFGFGVVVKKHSNSIRVKLDNRDDSLIYELDGRLNPADTFPTLYHLEGFVPPSCNEPKRKSECEFRPFDKVLVRDNEYSMWLPKFFSNYNNNNRHYHYYTTAGVSWKYCIPYEGNEDKCGKVTE